MKVSRRKSLEDFLCVGVLLKVMDRGAVRVQSKMKEKEKSSSASGKVIPLILQMGKEPSAQDRSPAVSLSQAESPVHSERRAAHAVGS